VGFEALSGDSRLLWLVIGEQLFDWWALLDMALQPVEFSNFIKLLSSPLLQYQFCQNSAKIVKAPNNLVNFA
jgi:hypothetical protein